MIKNTPEALQEVVEKLLTQNQDVLDCTEWECSECPFFLTEREVDPRYGGHYCGWLLLKSVTSKILRK